LHTLPTHSPTTTGFPNLHRAFTNALKSISKPISLQANSIMNHRTAALQASHVEQIQKTLDEAVPLEPRGRAVLSVKLGYPDFDPASVGEKDEDKLNQKVRKHSRCSHMRICFHRSILTTRTKASKSDPMHFLNVSLSTGSARRILRPIDQPLPAGTSGIPIRPPR
jgi:hypothetical protein